MILTLLGTRVGSLSRLIWTANAQSDVFLSEMCATRRIEGFPGRRHGPFRTTRAHVDEQCPFGAGGADSGVTKQSGWDLAVRKRMNKSCDGQGLVRSGSSWAERAPRLPSPPPAISPPHERTFAGAI